MQKQPPHILIVDDDNRILKLLKKFFEQNGLLVSVADSVPKAEELLRYFIYDLIILDVMLPNVTGLDFAKTIKSSGNNIPIVMLTALSEVEDRIRGLEAGAADYISKPFEPKELLLRITKLIESSSQHKKEQQITRFGRNYYDTATKEFVKNNQVVKLSTTEQKLLDILIDAKGNIISREELSKKMGESVSIANSVSKELNLRSIDVQITRLRNKIEDTPKEPQYLRTVRGEGYVLYT